MTLILIGLIVTGLWGVVSRVWRQWVDYAHGEVQTAYRFDPEDRLARRLAVRVFWLEVVRRSLWGVVWVSWAFVALSLSR